MMKIIINEAVRKGEAAPKNRPAPSPGVGQDAPPFSRSEIADIQAALEARGYRVGGVDGKWGGKTTSAVRAFQRDMGFEVTGRLSDDQLAVLLHPVAGDAGSLATAAADGSGIELLYDTDLPYNDYRSGLEDRALKGIPAGACQELCVADRQCQAFTYNQKAKVCFLKHTAATPVAFKGALSGRKTSVSAGEAGSDRPVIGSPAGEPEVAEAETPQDAASTQGFARGLAGMPMHDGAYVVAFSEARSGVLEGGHKAYDLTLVDFVKLLMLRGDPSGIEDKYLTGFYAGLLPLDEVAPFLGDRALAIMKKRAFLDVDLSQWKGEDQFEREDSRLAFLAAKREKILAMMPELPIELELMRSVTYGDYDAAGQELAIRIDDSDHWPSLGRIGLDAPLPALLPTTWSLDETAARAVFDARVAAEKRSRAEGRYLIPVSVSRVRLTGIRPSENSITLELEAISHKFFADQTMTQELGVAAVAADASPGGLEQDTSPSPVERMPNEELFRRLDLARHDGAVILADNSLWSKLHPRGEDAYDASTDKLGRLLLLMAHPEWLDAPERTYLFRPLVGLERAKPYLSQTSSAPGGIELASWAGDTPFEEEDSRQAFLAAFRSEILAMVPTLPLSLDFVRYIHYHEYHTDTQTLDIDISGSGVFRGFHGASLEYVGPYALPKTWAMPENKARALFKSAREAAERNGEDSVYPRSVFVGRTEVTAVRPTKNGVAVELAAVDIKVYADHGLDEQLDVMPLPEDAVRADTPAAAPAAAAADSIPFDPVFIRMLLARNLPEFAGTESFLRETFDMKREAERRQRVAGRPAVAAWPDMIPLALQSGRLEPNPEDYDRLKAWFEPARLALGSTATVLGFCGAPEEGQECQWPHQAITSEGTLNLSELVKAATADWHYGWHGLPDDAGEIAEAQFPGNSGLLPIGAGRDVPGFVVLHPDAAWYGIAIPKVAVLDAVLEVEVISHQVLGTPSGKGFIAVEIAPRTFRYLTEDGSWVSVPIEAAQPAEAAPRYDVLGVKLGMPLAEAEKLIEGSFGDRNVRRFDVLHKGGPDPILGPSVAFRSPGKPSMDKIGHEVVKLYFDQTQPDKPIIAIGRIARYADNESRDADDLEAAAPVFSAVVEKYGTPDYEAKLNDNIDASLWAVDPTARARIASDGDRQTLCGVDSAMAWISNDDGRFHSNLFKGDCGEVLAVWIREGLVSVYLADTSSILKLRAHYQAEYSAAQEAKKASAPKLKF